MPLSTTRYPLDLPTYTTPTQTLLPRRRTATGLKYARRRWGRLCLLLVVILALGVFVKASLGVYESKKPAKRSVENDTKRDNSQQHTLSTATSETDSLEQPQEHSPELITEEPQPTILSVPEEGGSESVVVSETPIAVLAKGQDHLSDRRLPNDEDDEEESSLRRIRVGEGDMRLSSHSPVRTSDPGKEGEMHSVKSSTFPSFAQFKAQDERADTLPDVIYTTFEDATQNDELQGWEDEWFAEADFDPLVWGLLEETKIDFVYTWVNGSDKAFIDTIHPYEMNSTLNDPEGNWVMSHKVNRYRDWDELRYSIRTVEKFAKFRGKIMLLVNSLGTESTALQATPDDPTVIRGRQTPLWLNDKKPTLDIVKVIPQEDLFDDGEADCLPTFDSLTIENQIYNTQSETDRFFALSDDMFLGKHHAASDLYSQLYGSTMGFKTNAYNTKTPPTDIDARRFGEKPFLIYTSWMLNRRFGERKRKGQVHFGHSMSRSVTKEAIKSFPRPALQSTCQRFRGETGFQLYSWYVTFHYTIERHREVLLWSYIMNRSDRDQNGVLDWSERQAIMAELEFGRTREFNKTFRDRQFYRLPEQLEKAGLTPPKVNIATLWTSLDGPIMIKDIECAEFDVNECMAPGFSTSSSDANGFNPVFSSTLIFDRVARQHVACGDCLLKLILNQKPRGLSPLLPNKDTQAQQRATVIKSLFRYQYTIVEPDALFVMVTDAQQVDQVLLKQLMKKNKEVGQICLNDDVSNNDRDEVEALQRVMKTFFELLVPEKSPYEL